MPSAAARLPRVFIRALAWVRLALCEGNIQGIEFMRHKFALSMTFAVFLVSCGGAESEDGAARTGLLAPAGWADAEGAFIDANGDEAGSFAIAESPTGGILLRVDLYGLSEGWHGIHLHQVADCSDVEEGFKLSGGHVDPAEREHGLMNPDGPEAADMPNLYAHGDGRATAEIFNARVRLRPTASAAPEGPVALIDEDGFAIIVHQSPDDHETQPIGGAGARVACAAAGGV